MRINAGDWRGRKIIAPKGDSTRPTADRTRETLFNMLRSRLGTFEGLRVADLFAGSGALGLEALSRGAIHCLFVEHEPAAIKSIKDNINALDTRHATEVRNASVMTLAPSSTPFDLMLLDPPYGTGAGAVALDRLLRLGWIDEDTLIAVETSVSEDISVKGLKLLADRRVGKAKLHILKRDTNTA